MENATINTPGTLRSSRFWLGLIGILVLGTIVVVSIIRDRIVNYPGWQVSVAGQGRVVFTPDIANINMGVQVDKAEKAEDALKQLNEKMAKIYAAIEKEGVSKDDIQTQNYSLSPQYDVVANVSKLTGYSANQVLAVKVRGIKEKAEASSKVIAAASKAGVNQINGISFEPADLNELKQEARLKAIADARSKADSIANSLGIKLGDVVGWWENYITPGPGMPYAEGGGGGMGGGGFANPTVPSGTQEIVIEVNVSYKIK